MSKSTTSSVLPPVPPGRVMVMKLDPDGAPRAWGAASTYGQALREAERQLEAYRARKREVGDPLADARFTDKTEMVV
jgi:hypothetical protein